MISLRRLFIVLTPFALSATLAACSGGSTGGDTRSAIERDDDMAMGDPKAPIVMVEYASLTCPHCATFHAEVLPTIKKDYIETGKVRYVFRQFPTQPVPYAVGGEAVARCAGPENYFELLNTLYAKQNYWVRSSNPRKALMEIAATAGINQEQFDACVSDQENIKRIQDISQEAQEVFKITGTPSFVINGKLRPRVRSPESFAEVFDQILGVKSEPKADDATDQSSTGEH